MVFKWVNFYQKFANKLLQYKDNRAELINVVYKAYEISGLNRPSMEVDNKLIDIDPFTVMGTFNKGLSDEKRIKHTKAFAELLGIAEEVPQDFMGIPVLNSLKATFYAYAPDRGEHDIDNLWEVFANAIAYADTNDSNAREDFVEYYNKAISQLCVKWNITMALYWIRPYKFINLDSRNRWFLTKPGCMPDEFIKDVLPLNQLPSAEEYLSICEKVQKAIDVSNYEYKNFPELSFAAWNTSREDDEIEKEEKKKGSNAAFLRWFAPVLNALKDLGGEADPETVRKKIIENEKLTPEEVNVTRGKTHINKFSNEVAFARNYLVYAGYIDKSQRGIWKLTDAGKTVEMTIEKASEIFNTYGSNSKTDKLGETSDNKVHYWVYSPGANAEKWDDFYNAGIMCLGWGEIGDLQEYSSKEEMRASLKKEFGEDTSQKNAANAVWEFANVMKKGDIVFVKKGRSLLVGKGVIESDYSFDATVDGEYKHIRTMNWTNNGEWNYPETAPVKTLTDITQYTELVEKVLNVFDDEIEVEDEEIEISYDKYEKEDFLEDVYMTPEQYDTLIGLIKKKKNVILQGAPGVGKTFAAKRIAYSMMGEKNSSRVMMVQFHQSYSYEDFIMGFRPKENGFELKKGAFYKFCREAEKDLENDYFFIIDEINRGNLSKIFGELFMLIEQDKRGVELQLLYSDEYFSVPKNVYIIGMMNTADRSLAMLDYALRRRFAFYDIRPGFDTDGFKKYQRSLNNTSFDKLIEAVKVLNNTIAEDETLGEGFCVGHSYFCDMENPSDNELQGIVNYELIPLVKEYWFDDSKIMEEQIDKLKGALG